MMLIWFLFTTLSFWNCDRIQAEEALAAKEVPVGCVFVKDGLAIAKARNRTNEWRNVSSVLISLPSLSEETAIPLQRRRSTPSSYPSTKF